MPEARGKLRERIVIQAPTEGADAEGNPVSTWNTLFTVWARAEYLSGRELEAAQKINSEITVRLTTNYIASMVAWDPVFDPALDPTKMRTVWRNQEWNIHAVQPTEDKFDMHLMCSKVE